MSLRVYNWNIIILLKCLTKWIPIFDINTCLQLLQFCYRYIRVRNRKIFIDIKNLADCCHKTWKKAFYLFEKQVLYKCFINVLESSVCPTDHSFWGQWQVSVLWYSEGNSVKWKVKGLSDIDWTSVEPRTITSRCPSTLSLHHCIVVKWFCIEISVDWWMQSHRRRVICTSWYVRDKPATNRV